MNGQQMGWRPPRRFSVVVQRLARPPMPWTWAIHEDGVSDPYHCSSRFYRSAEEAWTVGRTVLDRITNPAYRTSVEERRIEPPEAGPMSN